MAPFFGIFSPWQKVQSATVYPSSLAFFCIGSVAVEVAVNAIQPAQKSATATRPIRDPLSFIFPSKIREDLGVRFLLCEHRVTGLAVVRDQLPVGALVVAVVAAEAAEEVFV